MLNFRLDARSGMPTYMQLVHQVREALRVGTLQVDDQLPTAKEVVALLAINPNTVLKAYRELEHEGLVAGRPGQGTFVVRTLGATPPLVNAKLRAGLARWLAQATAAGLDDD